MSSPRKTQSDLLLRAGSASPAVRQAVVNDPNATIEVLRLLVNDPNTKVRATVASSGAIGIDELLATLILDQKFQVWINAAENPAKGSKTYDAVVHHATVEVGEYMARRAYLEPPEFEAELANSRHPQVRGELAGYTRRRPIFEILMRDSEPRVRARTVLNWWLPCQEDIRNLAGDRSAVVRESIAYYAREPLPDDIVDRLIADKSAKVRHALLVAIGGRRPPFTIAMRLRDDPDPQVANEARSILSARSIKEPSKPIEQQREPSRYAPAHPAFSMHFTDSIYDPEDWTNDDQPPFGADEGADEVAEWMERTEEIVANPRLEYLNGDYSADNGPEDDDVLIAQGFILLRVTGQIDPAGRVQLRRALKRRASGRGHKQTYQKLLNDLDGFPSTRTD